jgi:hypothetical protein
MAYGKISIDKVIQSQPDLAIGPMLAAAIEDHTTANGCEFQWDTLPRVVEFLDLDSAAAAAELPDAMRHRIGMAMEAMEIECKHRGQS